MPRTTLMLDNDAFKAAHDYAKRRKQTLGEAVSELVLRATNRELVTDEVGGLHVVRLHPDSPRVTAAKVKELEDSNS